MNHNFVAFLPIPIEADEQTLYIYYERLQFVNEDLDWLLKLSNYKFLQELTHNETIMRFLDSFLKFAPRPYEVTLTTKGLENVKTLYQQIKKKVYLVFYRIPLAYEHTKSDEFKLAYKKGFVDMAKALDIAILYQGNNSLPELIHKLIENQTDFVEQIRECSEQMIKTITSLIIELDYLYQTSASSEEARSANSIKVIDILYYLIDLSISFSAFVEILPNYAKNLFDSEIQNGIMNLIEEKLDKLRTKINSLCDPENIKLLEYKTKVAKYELSNMVCQFIFKILDTLQKEPLNEDELENVLYFFNKLSEDKSLLKYFHDNFNFNDRVRSAKVFQEKKTQQITYLFDNIPQGIFFYTEEPETYSDEGAVGGIEETPSTSNVDDKLQAHLQYLQELFPDQNEIFFKECLIFYKNNVDSVVNAILENQIPAEVKHSISKKQYEQTELGQRRNIFDGDQFDLKNLATADESIKAQIHIGKKDKTSDFELTRQESLVAYDNDYEDEYDDTYDANTGFDVEFSDEEHEFVVKPLNEKIDTKKRDKFEDEEEATESSGTEMRKPQFSQQPLPQRQKRPGPDGARFKDTKQESGDFRGRYDAQRPQSGNQRNQWQNREQPREGEDRNQPQEQQHQQQRTDYAYKKKTTQNPHNRRNLALKKQNHGFFNQNQ